MSPERGGSGAGDVEIGGEGNAGDMLAQPFDEAGVSWYISRRYAC